MRETASRFAGWLQEFQWSLERCQGQGKAVDTPVGFVPTLDGIAPTGLDLADGVMNGLLKVDAAEWVEAGAGQDDFMKSYGSRMPKSIWNQHNELAQGIQDAAGLTINH